MTHVQIGPQGGSGPTVQPGPGTGDPGEQIHITLREGPRHPRHTIRGGQHILEDGPGPAPRTGGQILIAFVPDRGPEPEITTHGYPRPNPQRRVDLG